MFMEIMAKDLTELATYASKCTPGSLGYLEDATVYRLGTQGTWVKVGEDVPSRLNTLTSQLAEIDTRVDALETRTVKLYGVLWDGVNAQCVRTRDAAGIPVVTTNFGHFGAVNPSKANPFDALYPWRDRGVVNIDMTAYASLLTSGGEIEGCISAYCGDPGFN
jgi:hypothetical protein